MSQNKHFAGKVVVAVAVSMLVGVSAFAESRHRNETGMRDSGGANTSDRGRTWSRGAERSGDRGGDRTTTSREPRISRERQPRGGSDVQRGDRGTVVQPERDRGDRSGTWNRDNNNRGSRDETRTRNSNTNRGDRNGTWNRDNNNRGDRNGTWNRDNNRGRNDQGNRNGSWNRNDNRGRGNGGWQRPPARDRYGREAYYGRGSVSRCERYGSGYRVWISGSRYPFFVPLSYYDSRRFRVGISLDLWGYYNPLGYYDYYDAGYTSYRGVRSDFRGVVEEVDYRRDRLVVRNDDTGNFVTVNLGNRRFDDVRPGDTVWIEGDWTRSSVFVAYDLRLIDDDRYDEYGR